MTNVIFAQRTADDSLKSMPIKADTTLADLLNCDVFTVFADSANEAIAGANAATAKVNFKGIPQTGSVLGKDGNTRHFVRVWKSAPISTDASALLGI